MSPEAQGKLDVQALVNRGVTLAQRELETILLGLKERGAGRFGRILALGLAAVAASYMMLYAPASRKLATVDRRIATAKSAAKYADRYKDLHQRLDQVYSQLPSGNQSDAWITDRLRQTLADHSLVSESISQPEIHPADGYTDEVVRFTTSAKFSDLVAWLDELEFGKSALHVTALGIEKDSTQIGMNHLTCAVEALTPAQGAKP